MHTQLCLELKVRDHCCRCHSRHDTCFPGLLGEIFMGKVWLEALMGLSQSIPSQALYTTAFLSPVSHGQICAGTSGY